jgi:prepilin-type N-terminal cleavage/methylation domain-containing protein
MNLKTDEKGFTLIELLVVISILVLVVGAASMTVITMMRVTPQNNNWTIALRQVQNAGYWISRDVQMSNNITVGNGNPTFLTLVLPQVQPPNRTIVYQFQNISGEQWLFRNESTGGQIAIAQYISIPTSPVYNNDNRTLTFTITATSGNVPVTRQYEAMQRVPP